jgi:hypothetical protein
MHNDGAGIRIKPFIQPTFPPLEAGERRRKNAKKPKLVAGEVFFVHEALRLEDFLPEVMEKVNNLGNLRVPLKYMIVAGRVRSTTVKFAWSVRTAAETPLMSFAAWKDCIHQVNAKIDTDLKIIVEEVEVRECHLLR